MKGVAREKQTLPGVEKSMLNFHQAEIGKVQGMIFVGREYVERIKSSKP